jgi:hypothetical protein
VHSNFALFTCQPTYFEEAIKEENWVKEMDSIEKNDTQDLVELPEGKD